TLDGFAAADPEELEDVIETLQAQYDYVLVDTGAGLSFESVLPIGMTDGVLLVTTPDRAAVEDTVKTAEIVSLAGGTVLGAVLTRARESEQTDAISDKLDTELLGIIPEDPAVQASIDAQKPLITLDADSPAATAYRDLGQVMLDRIDQEETMTAGPSESLEEGNDDAASDPDDSTQNSDPVEETDETQTDRASEPTETGSIPDASGPEPEDSRTEPEREDQGLGETADPLDELPDHGDTVSGDSGPLPEEAERSVDSPARQESGEREERETEENPSDLAEGTIGAGVDSSDPIDDFLDDADSSPASDATESTDAPLSESEGASTTSDDDAETESSDEDHHSENEPGEDPEPSDGTPDHTASSADVDGLDDVVGATADADAIAHEIEASLDEESVEGEGTTVHGITDDESNSILGDDALDESDGTDNGGGVTSVDQPIGDDTASGSAADLPSDAGSSSEDVDATAEASAVEDEDEEGSDSEDGSSAGETERPDDEDAGQDESDADEESSGKEDEPEGGISIPEAPSDGTAESTEDDEDNDDEGGRGILSRILHPFG
ncbi:MAG: AAA family ATPase, partial [Halobacteriales archaeon]|nr:AAA family ATPase [Halobacteriales archaeon]